MTRDEANQALDKGNRVFLSKSPDCFYEKLMLFARPFLFVVSTNDNVARCLDPLTMLPTQYKEDGWELYFPTDD